METNIEGKQKILVFGLWHLGLVHCACLPKLGHNVIGTDFDNNLVTKILKNELPIYEPGLEEMIKGNVNSNVLTFSKIKGEILENADFIFVTFDIPVDDNDVADPSVFNKAIAYLVDNIKCNKSGEYPIVVISSQVKAGTCKKIKKQFDLAHGSNKVKIAHIPENLRLNNAIKIFLEPDRLVFGVDDKETEEKLLKVFEPIDCKKIITSMESSEMSKHAMNAYLATCISFTSEISDLCEALGANAFEVIETLKADKRVSPKAPLRPGFGFAGGTLGRDVQALRNLGKENKVKTALLDSVLSVNRDRINALIKKIKNRYETLDGLTIGILGLTYKPNTNTLRRSISVEIASALKKKGVVIKAYDPKIIEETSETKGILSLHTNPYDAARDCDAIILATEWPEFKELDFSKIKSITKMPIVYDIKNYLDGEYLKSIGYEYHGMGV